MFRSVYKKDVIVDSLPAGWIKALKSHISFVLLFYFFPEKNQILSCCQRSSNDIKQIAVN